MLVRHKFFMNSVALEVKENGGIEDSSSRILSLREKASALVELTKPRITFLVTAIAAAGFLLATPREANSDFTLLFHALVAIALLSSGVATLNQLIERRQDALMRRTEMRPLPSGRVTAREAFAVGVFLIAIAEIYLAVRVNSLTALLGLSVVVGYVLLYTPLKTKTSLATVIGAFPGAMPPVMGWTAATGTLSIEAWTLFVILFLWQFPHFLAIAWMYREDYRRAGILMLPVVDSEGSATGQQIIAYSLMLLPVSLLPTFLGMSGQIYLVGAVVLGAGFLWSSVRAARTASRVNARRLLLASVLYLPLVFLLMVID
jgi:heme o synthase